MKKELITRDGFNRLRDELIRIKSVERPDVLQKLEEARKLGDLKENSEYHDAKEQLAVIDSRIRYLEIGLSSIDIIDISALKKESNVSFGSLVKVQNVDTKEIIEYRIVGEMESDIDMNLISISSPIAVSMFGKSVNETFQLIVPSGTTKYKILKISV